jgi:predicted transposase YbfD/YdcC
MKKAYMTNIISLLLVNIFDFGQNINQTCQVQIDTRYFSTEGQGQFFSKFGKFSDILLDCNQTYNASEHIYIEPSIELLIDNSFQIGKLFKEDQFNLIKDINLGNIKGIDVQSKFIESSIETFILASFRFSKLDVYLNEKILNSSQCNTKIYNNLNNFFQYFVAIVFSQVRYPKNELCPLIFLNSISKQFIFEDIINSYLTKNRLIFSKLNVSEDFDMGIRRIYMVTLFLYYENLSANNMDNHLFKRVIELKIFRTIENIEVGLLRNFKSLKNIDFQIDN